MSLRSPLTSYDSYETQHSLKKLYATLSAADQKFDQQQFQLLVTWVDLYKWLILIFLDASLPHFFLAYFTEFGLCSAAVVVILLG